MEFFNENLIKEKEDCPHFYSPITAVIRNRRSIYADRYYKKEIPAHELEEILTNATWAPTHKMTEPWRFIILSDEQQVDYGNYMFNYHKDRYYDLPEVKRTVKFEYLKNYPLNAACIVAVVFQKNSQLLPEWEEIAAISCAVQNMALTCTALNIGSYWASGGAAVDYVKTLGLTDREQSFGLFFMGYYDLSQKPVTKRRTAIAEKVIGLKHI
ncbi:nitroreductase family protein [Olivibacter domesticus]|uniref:Nitroreductase n=1 Tax=Olivibacter domesticus TaxID=407022 RepID=A0A1H7MTG6_OLID1|nr:nitroreductase [Olivibacter domesticus]SEL14349.1 Nitroreductase [Olivibacter domesticus]